MGRLRRGGGGGGGGGKRAGDNGKGKARLLFFDYCYFYWDTSWEPSTGIVKVSSGASDFFFRLFISLWLSSQRRETRLLLSTSMAGVRSADYQQQRVFPSRHVRHTAVPKQ